MAAQSGECATTGGAEPDPTAKEALPRLGLFRSKLLETAGPPEDSRAAPRLKEWRAQDECFSFDEFTVFSVETPTTVDLP